MDAPSTDPARQLLRHALATIAYRGGKALRGADATVAAYRPGEKSRTPLEILAHVNDLFDWGLSLCRDQQAWRDSTPAGWDAEVARFHAGLGALDEFLASDQPLGFPPEKLLQGPIADALAHVGQIAMLRRLAGSPIKGENYLRAEIVAGRVGPEQAAPRREFD